MSLLVPALVAALGILMILRARREIDLLLGALLVLYAAFVFTIIYGGLIK